MAGDPQKWPLALTCSQWGVDGMVLSLAVGYQLSAVSEIRLGASFLSCHHEALVWPRDLFLGAFRFSPFALGQKKRQMIVRSCSSDLGDSRTAIGERRGT